MGTDDSPQGLQQAFSLLPKALFYSGVGFFSLFVMYVLLTEYIGPEINGMELLFVVYGMVGSAMMFTAGGMYLYPLTVAIWRRVTSNRGDLHVE